MWLSRGREKWGQEEVGCLPSHLSQQRGAVEEEEEEEEEEREGALSREEDEADLFL